MDYFNELLTSYELLKKRKLRINMPQLNEQEAAAAVSPEQEQIAMAAAQQGFNRGWTDEYYPPEAPGTRIWQAKPESGAVILASNRQVGTLHILGPEGSILDKSTWDTYVSLFNVEAAEPQEGGVTDAQDQGGGVGEEEALYSPEQTQVQQLLAAYPQRGEEIVKALDEVCGQLNSMSSEEGFFTDSDSFVDNNYQFDKTFCLGPVGSIASMLLNRAKLGAEVTKTGLKLIDREQVSAGQIIDTLKNFIESLTLMEKLHSEHSSFGEEDAAKIKAMLRLDDRSASRTRVFITNPPEDNFGIAFDWAEEGMKRFIFESLVERYESKLENTDIPFEKYRISGAKLVPNYSKDGGNLNNVMKQASERLNITMVLAMQGNRMAAAASLLKLWGDLGDNLFKAYRTLESVDNGNEFSTERTEELRDWLRDFEQMLSEDYPEITDQAKQGMISIFKRTMQLSGNFIRILNPDMAIHMGGKSGEGKKADTGMVYLDKSKARDSLTRLGVSNPDKNIKKLSVKHMLMQTISHNAWEKGGDKLLQAKLDQLNADHGVEQNLTFEDSVHVVGVSIKSYLPSGSRRLFQSGDFNTNLKFLETNFDKPGSWAHESFNAVGANTPAVKMHLSKIAKISGSLTKLLSKKLAGAGVSSKSFRTRVLKLIQDEMGEEDSYTELIKGKDLQKLSKKIEDNPRYAGRHIEVARVAILNKLIPEYLERIQGTTSGRKTFAGLLNYCNGSSDSVLGLDMSLLPMESHMSDHDSSLRQDLKDYIAKRNNRSFRRSGATLENVGDSKLSLQRAGKAWSWGGYGQSREEQKLVPAKGSPKPESISAGLIRDYLNKQQTILEAILLKLP